jgi:hypothetical protein
VTIAVGTARVVTIINVYAAIMVAMADQEVLDQDLVR